MKQIIISIIMAATLLSPLMAYCQDSFDFSFVKETPGEGINKIETKIEGNVVTTRVNVLMNCAFEPENPSYTRKDDEITFFFETKKPPIPGVMHRCLYTATIQFKLTSTSIKGSQTVRVMKDNEIFLPEKDL